MAQVGIALTLRSKDTAAWLRRCYTDYDIDEPFFSAGPIRDRITPPATLHGDPQGHRLRQQQGHRSEILAACWTMRRASWITTSAAALYHAAQQQSSRTARRLVVRGAVRDDLQQEAAGPHNSPARHLPGLRARLVGALRHAALALFRYPVAASAAGGVGILVLNFFLIRLAPGDAASVLAGESGAAWAEYAALLREKFGLHRPLLMSSSATCCRPCASTSAIPCATTARSSR